MKIEILVNLSFDFYCIINIIINNRLIIVYFGCILYYPFSYDSIALLPTHCYSPLMIPSLSLSSSRYSPCYEASTQMHDTRRIFL